MSPPKLPDELLLRYRQACTLDERRPSPRVREAVRAHAAMLAQAQVKNTPRAPIRRPLAANQMRWQISLLASLALVGLTTLLVLQFQRGTPEEQELALGQPNLPVPRASPMSPAATSATPSLPEKPTDQPQKDAGLPVAHVPSAPTRPYRPSQATDARADLAKSATPPVERKLPASPARTQEQAPPPAPAAPAAPAAQVAAMPPPTLDANPTRPTGAGALQANSAAVAQENSAQRAAKAVAPKSMMAPAPLLQKSEQQRQLLDQQSPAMRSLGMALLESARSGNVAQMEDLLRQGAPINATDDAGRTPLILATLNGHTAMAQRLLTLGANPTLSDHKGLSALQHAQRLGFKAIADLLESGP